MSMNYFTPIREIIIFFATSVIKGTDSQITYERSEHK